MKTRLDGVRARLGIYQFAEDAFGGPAAGWHRACEIGNRRYVITEDLAFCVRTLLLCQHFLDERSPEAEAALRNALAEREA